MGALGTKDEMVQFWNNRTVELLQMRRLPEDELAYLLTKVETMKDERLKNAIAGLIGWGDQEEADMQTFCAIALQLMADSRPSVIREASRKIEIRAILNGVERYDSSTEYPTFKKGKR
jgi:hypothetical protein